MDVSLLKDEILTLQTRLEDKKQLLENSSEEIAKTDSILVAAKLELSQQKDNFKAEILRSLTEKKEKARIYKFIFSNFCTFRKKSLRNHSGNSISYRKKPLNYKLRWQKPTKIFSFYLQKTRRFARFLLLI